MQVIITKIGKQAQRELKYTGIYNLCVTFLEGIYGFLFFSNFTLTTSRFN
jgi:hypothetical protein